MQTEAYNKQIRIDKENITADICLDFFNERLRVDDYRGSISALNEEVGQLVQQHQFSKTIIKARTEHVSPFLEHGYLPEALFTGYFNGGNATMMCRFHTNERKRSDYWTEEDDIMDQIFALPLKGKQESYTIPEPYSIRLAEKGDSTKLSALYGSVFEIYPTPMNNPSYIDKTMDDGTIYYIVERDGQIVSAASAEINEEYHNAEITDCATLPEHRKYGLMKILIDKLENELKRKKIFCAYSIARSLSFGMNAVFYQRSYKYKGRMIKNCRIFDKYEDMNLWVRDLSEEKC